MRKLSADIKDCYPRNCPAIFETEDGQDLVVGRVLREPPAEAGVGPGEAAVVIPRAVLESAARALGES